MAHTQQQLRSGHHVHCSRQWFRWRIIWAIRNKPNSGDTYLTRWMNWQWNRQQIACAVAPDESLQQSHRHLSHLMSIHPLGILNIDGDDHDRDVIRASLEQLRSLGTRAWTGYSFSWAAAMEARAGRPEDSLDFLQKYVHAFILAQRLSRQR